MVVGQKPILKWFSSLAAWNAPSAAGLRLHWKPTVPLIPRCTHTPYLTSPDWSFTAAALYAASAVFKVFFFFSRWNRLKWLREGERGSERERKKKAAVGCQKEKRKPAVFVLNFDDFWVALFSARDAQTHRECICSVLLLCTQHKTWWNEPSLFAHIQVWVVVYSPCAVTLMTLNLRSWPQVPRWRGGQTVDV